jgi:uncharacterized protein YfcZ (UPF0381/DUF406 family)
MTSRDLAAMSFCTSMDVGSVMEVRDELITRNQVFPSPDEAAAAMD